MENKSKTVIDTSDREIITRRLLNAPRELVFEAFTQPEHLAKWWGPNGFTITMQEFDLRPGGMWRVILHGPDGHDYPNKMMFVELVKPERIVIKHIGEEPEPVSHQMNILLEEQGDKTNLTLQLVFDTAAERERVVTRYNAIEGGIQTINRLEEHLADETSDREMVITRIFNAPRELVYKVWTDPKHVANWWGPNSFTIPACEIDLRVGGEYKYIMRSPDGAETPLSGNYLEVVENERIVFKVDTFKQKDRLKMMAEYLADPNIDYSTIHSIVTVTFEDDGDKTKLTLAWRFISAAVRDKIMLSGMVEGLNESLDKLKDELEGLTLPSPKERVLTIKGE